MTYSTEPQHTGLTRTVWIDRPLVCLTREAAAQWRWWLGQHGLDPDVICLDRAIFCDDDACTVSFEMWEPTAGEAARPVRRSVTLQLSEPALAFPLDTAYAVWTSAWEDDDDLLEAA